MNIDALKDDAALNIGIVVAGFAAHEQEWYQPFLEDYVRRLATDHHVRVFAIDYPARSAPYRWHNGTVFAAGSQTNQRSRWHNIYLQINHQHQSQPFDLLHAFGAGESGAVATLAAEQLAIPSLVNIVDDELVYFPDLRYGLMGNPDQRRLVMQSLLKATLLIAPCLYTADQLSELLEPEDHERIRIVPFGVDTDYFHPPEVSLDFRPRAFVHVGALEPVKDQRTLIYLLSTLPNSTLDIVGDGSQREALQAYTASLGIDDRVVFHGWVPYEKLPAFYQEAQFCLITSHHEAFGIEAIEALACGTSVIGTAVGVLPELGNMAPIGDIEQLQRRIINRSRSNRMSLRFRNRLLAEQAYSLDQMVSVMVATYEDVVVSR